MKRRSLPCLGPHGFHNLAYREWGGGDAGLLCVHGLTRNSRDFDFLAQELAADYRIACPDMAGRGESDWLINHSGYDFPLYVQDTAALIARLDLPHIDFVGTSMGGWIGMLLAAQRNSPIRKLVLNDVGAFLGKAAVARIRDTAMQIMAHDPLFTSLDEAERQFRRGMTSFGALSDAQWRHISEHGLRPVDGGFKLHYDPAIVTALSEREPQDVDLWALWDLVQCPVLVLRGAESDVLSAEVAEEMRRRRPDKTRIVEFAGVGHAPMLMEAGQIAAVKDWLLS